MANQPTVKDMKMGRNELAGNCFMGEKEYFLRCLENERTHHDDDFLNVDGINIEFLHSEKPELSLNDNSVLSVFLRMAIWECCNEFDTYDYHSTPLNERVGFIRKIVWKKFQQFEKDWLLNHRKKSSSPITIPDVKKNSVKKNSVKQEREFDSEVEQQLQEQHQRSLNARRLLQHGIDQWTDIKVPTKKMKPSKKFKYPTGVPRIHLMKKSCSDFGRKMNPVERVLKLSEMFEKGMLTPTEFEIAKEKALE